MLHIKPKSDTRIVLYFRFIQLIEKRKQDLENNPTISEISCDVCNKGFATQGSLSAHKSMSQLCNLKAINEAKKILSDSDQTFRYYFSILMKCRMQHIIT